MCEGLMVQREIDGYNPCCGINKRVKLFSLAGKKFYYVINKICHNKLQCFKDDRSIMTAKSESI